MTKENFIKLIKNIQKFDKELDKWYKFGIDIVELPIADIPWIIFDTAIDSLFKPEGVDIINWYLFEKYGLNGNKNYQKHDKDGNIIPTDTIEDLWLYVKEYLK